MSGLEKSLFQLKFTAKSLQRQARKATKDETAEKAKLEAQARLKNQIGQGLNTLFGKPKPKPKPAEPAEPAPADTTKH